MAEIDRTSPRSTPAALSDALGDAKSFEDLAQRTARACAHLARAEICTIWRLYTEEGGARRLRLAAAHGVHQPRTLALEVTYPVTPEQPRYEGVTSYVASARRRVLVKSFEELQAEYGFCHKGKMDVIQWRGEPQRQFGGLYAVPLTLGNELVGVLKLEHYQGRGPFTDADIAAVDALAGGVAAVVKSLVLLDAYERRLIDEPARLTEALVQRPFETDELTQTIVDKTAEILGAEVCSLWLVDNKGQNLVHRADFGFRGAKAQVPSYRIDGNPDDDAQIHGITAWVAIRRKAFWANTHEELRKHPSWRGTWDPTMYGTKDEAAAGFRSMYAVPLLWNNDLLGVLKVENPGDGGYFSANDHRKCDLMANYVVLLLALTKQLRLQLIPFTAHVLKGPAANIAMNLADLERELTKAAPKPERVRTSLDILKRLTLTALTLSGTLATQVEARVGHQERQQVDLVKLLDEQVRQIRPLIPSGGGDLRLDTDAPEYEVSLRPIDRAGLAIVLFNLLHNAIKFGSHLGPITIACNRAAGTISVADQGPGIPRGRRDAIFQPGNATRAAGWPDGTGLGLSDALGLLKQLGWSITVDDNPPRGAVFTIFITSGGPR